MTAPHRPETSPDTLIATDAPDIEHASLHDPFETPIDDIPPAPHPAAPQPEASAPVEPEHDPYARPMSERQRRRLAEQQRQAEERAKAAERQNQFLSPLDEASEGALTTPNETQPSVATTKVAKTSKPKKNKTAGSSTAYVFAIVGSALWVGGIATWFAYEFGSGLVDLDPVRIAVYVLIALAPVGLAFLLAHALRLGSALAHESKRARELADAMVAPTLYGAQQTSDIVSSLRGDIDEAAGVAERARQELTQLREILLTETTRLSEAARTAQAASQNITRSMGDERQHLASLGENLDTKALAVADAVQRQAQMVVEASDMAQAQLREAEAALAARAADLAAAANEAQDAARVATEDLGRQTLRLEAAGTGVTEQIKAVEDGLSQQRAALVTAAYSLRTDQEDFAAQIESQRAQFVEHLSLTRTAASDLNQTGDQIADGIKSQVEAVLDQFRTLVGMSQREAEGFDAATKLSLDKFEALAAESRERLLSETRTAVETLNRASSEQRELAEQALQQAQIRADRLGESLFDAARQADNAAESRIAGARRIVDETLKMVDLTGIEAMSRLESLTQRMNEALVRIEGSVRDLDERAARLPEEAAQRMAAVRQTAEQNLASLSDASRRAAAEAEALDVGFQDRVRKNYEMVNEAVRLMGNPPTDTPAAEDMRVPLRPAPSLHDTQLASPQHTAPSVPISVLTERAVSAIRRMGVDPNALLPRARIEDAAYALARQDIVRARQIVRRVAPAAVRSVNRRVIADQELNADIQNYLERFAAVLGDYGDDQNAINTRLATDEGRAFLIYDAAMGEIH